MGKQEQFGDVLVPAEKVVELVKGRTVDLEVPARAEIVIEGYVEKGELLAVVEAMKMETSLLAPFSGTVVGVPCAVGEAVAAGQVVVEVDAGGSG